MSESGDICGDNRFEIIENAKQELLKCTNIDTSSKEMDCLDSILFRMWQMKWLPGCKEDSLSTHRKTMLKERLKEIRSKAYSPLKEQPTDQTVRELRLVLQSICADLDRISDRENYYGLKTDC